MELSYKSAIAFGWSKLKEQWRMMLVVLLFMVGFQFLSMFMTNKFETIWSLFSIPLSIFISFVMMTYTLFVAFEAGDASLREQLSAYGAYLRQRTGTIGRFVVMQLLMFVIVFVLLLGMAVVALLPVIIGSFVLKTMSSPLMVVSVVLGVVAFIILMLVSMRLQWAGYLLIEGIETGAVTSLKRSWALTKGKVWWLFGWMWVSIGIVLLGLVVVILGVFPALAITTLATVYIYKAMLDEGRDRVQSGRVPQPTRKVEEPVMAMPGQEMM